MPASENAVPDGPYTVFIQGSFKKRPGRTFMLWKDEQSHFGIRLDDEVSVMTDAIYVGGINSYMQALDVDSYTGRNCKVYFSNVRQDEPTITQKAAGIRVYYVSKLLIEQ